MEPKEKILNQFAELVEKDKFSTEEWNKRGLNPSDENVIAYMNSRLEIVIKIQVKEHSKKYLKKDLQDIEGLTLTQKKQNLLLIILSFLHISWKLGLAII